MRFAKLDATLDDWLAWQERLHPSSIDLGLDRVRAVLAGMGLENPPYRVLTVGGTNGKGSVAHAAANMLAAAGHSVGLYTSPHLSRYNERVRIDGVEADDAEFCAAFAAVEAARGDISLTYFEFGSLAALEMFRRRGVDVAVLEVGLGGRLDAVNAVDPEVSVVVSVGLDHTDWLGDSIDAIAREKAGIFRPGRPAIFGRGPAPESLRQVAESLGARLSVGGEDYRQERAVDGWTYRDGNREITGLPPGRMIGAHQLDNAATALAAVLAFEPELADEAIRRGLAATVVPGRLEMIRLDDERQLLLDVGHNAAAAAAVASALAADPRPTRAVLGMLADKDAGSFVAALADVVDAWYPVTLKGDRGRNAEALADAMPLDSDIRGRYATVDQAVAAALAETGAGGRILVCGSFHTVGEFRASGLYSSLARPDHATNEASDAWTSN